MGPSLVQGLTSFARYIKAGHKPPIFSSNQLIHLFSKHGHMLEARKLFDEMHERNVFTWNSIISAYIKSQNLLQAQLLFDAAPQRDSVTYNSMLSGYVNTDGYETNACNLFVQMQYVRDTARIDEFTLTTMLNLTAKLCTLRLGRQLHTFMVKTGNNFTGFAVSALIDMYSKCGCFREACEVFNGCGTSDVFDVVSKNALVASCCREGHLDMARKLFLEKPELNDVVSWNTMISGYTKNGYDEEAIQLFVRMGGNGFSWNEHSFASVLSACSSLKNLNLGKELHARILKEKMISLNPFITSGIVDLYCKCGNMKYAEAVHSSIETGNVFSISSMIVGYSTQGCMSEARRIFDSLTKKNSVVWTAMFSGYLRSGCCEEVFELFRILKSEEETAVLDGLVLITLLGTCAIQATIDPGKQIHAYMYRMRIDMDEKITSSILDMYSKCGNIIYAQRTFEKLANVKDSVTYNVMIAAFAHHGYENEAFQLFDEMIKRGLRPDAVTFIGILSACRHCGLVEAGEKYFSSMTETYDIAPEIDHYACMIDLYGRANKLEKALDSMRKIPFKVDGVILGAFLNACRLYGHVELAREAEEELLRIEGNNGARYVQLANIYASEGKWDEMGRIRKRMKGNDANKFAGCSWVHLRGRVHVFTSGDTFHSQVEAMYCLLDFLTEDLSRDDDIDVDIWVVFDAH